jgi:hypothetical protein
MIVSFALMLIAVGMGAAVRSASLPTVTVGGHIVVLDRGTMLSAYALSAALLLAAYLTLAASLRRHARPLGRRRQLVRGLLLIALGLVGGVAVTLWTRPALGGHGIESTVLLALGGGALALNAALLACGATLLRPPVSRSASN